MYPLPDDILSYVHIDQSVILSVLSGLFLLPIPIILLFLLFWGWREGILRDHSVAINRLENLGFTLQCSWLLPSCLLTRNQEQIWIYTTPLLGWMSIIYGDKRKEKIPLEDVQRFIDSLDPVEPISRLQDV